MADHSRMNTGKAGNTGDFDATEPEIIGVNHLVQAIDQFQRTVDKLENVANKFAQSFQGGQSSYGHYTASPQQQAGPPNTGGGFANALPGMGLGPPRMAGQPGYSPVGNVPPPVPPPPGQAPPGNGGYPQGQNPFGPPKTVHKIGGFAIPYTKGAKYAGVLGAAAALSSIGEDQFKTQVNMSSFVQQQQLMAPGNFTGQGFAQAARFQAYGGRNQNLNSIAFNAQDASSGQFILSQLAGQSANRNSTYSMPLGRAGQAAANMFGYANPGLGYGGAANIASQLYNPQTSLRMLQLGYSSTPLRPGGGVNQPGRVMSSLIQQMFRTGRGGISPQSLAYQLRSGSVGQIALEQAIGSNDPNTVASWTSMLEAFNRLTTGAGGQKKLTSGQAQQLLNQASRGNTGAQNTLNAYGVNRSDLQNIKNANAARTGTSADIADAFNKGLEAATSSLESFRKMLDSLARTPFGQAGATGGGFLGTMASIANPGGLVGVAGSIAQIAMLKKLSTAMKAGGATAATRSLIGGAATGTAARGAGLAGAVDAALPFALSAAYLYATTKIKVPGTGKSIWGLGSSTPGQPHGLFGQKAGTPGANPLNSWGQLFHDIGTVVTSPFHALLSGGGGQTVQQIAKNGPMQAAPSGNRSSGNKFKGGKRGPKTGVSAAAATAVQDAKKELGVPYVFGGESPGVGFDCSGLVQWAYGQAGVALPRTSEDQYAATKGREIDPTKAQAGDLVFQGGADGTANNPGHVALMASQTQIIEAPHTGLNVRMRAYSDKEWSHVTRPTGGLGGSSALPIGSRSNNPNGPIGNHGLSASAAIGMGTGNYGSSEEVDNVAAALMSTAATGGAMGSNGPSGAKGSNVGGKSGGTGGTITAPGPGRVGWAQSLLRAIGAPQTQANKAAIVVWEVSEGGGFGNQATNNPLNLNPGPGANWPGHNANGAWAFPTAEDGLRETARYLGMPNYIGINAALMSGKNEHAVLQAIVSSPWAASHYAGNNEMQSGLRNTTRGRIWGLAHGTNYAPPGMAWLGERGPELGYLPGGAGVNTAAQSFALMQAQKRPAERPHQAHMPNGLNTLTGVEGGIKIDLHFDKGSICISADNERSVHQIAEEFANNVRRVLAEDRTLHAVASGRNFG